MRAGFWLGVALAAHLPAVVSGQWQYQLGSNEVTITRYEGEEAVIAVPTRIDGLPVTGIGYRAFANRTNVTCIALPATVRSVGERAFEYCSSLMDVNIPAGVTNIGVLAFSHCTALPVVVVPDSVVSIGQSAFQFCCSLTNAVLPESITDFGGEAFSGCRNLKVVRLPVRSIGSYDLGNCVSLERIALSRTVTSISDHAFSSCVNLAEIAVDAGNPRYGSVDGILFDRAQTTLLRYPSSRHGPYVVPEHVTAIGAGAFVGPGLTRVAIPAGTTKIETKAFRWCSNLVEITVAPGNLAYEGVDGVLFDKGRLVLIQFPAAKAATAFTVPENVRSVGPWAFGGARNLRYVVLPAALTNIGEAAFGWSQLTNVVVPAGVREVSWGAFRECHELTRVALPPSLENEKGRKGKGVNSRQLTDDGLSG